METERPVFEKDQRLGRYQLKSRLAIGGMAEVWLADAQGVGGFHKTVVLKMILNQYADDASLVRMFRDEATLAANLTHPNIVQIFDLGEIGETYFIAMEFIAGKTFRQIQRKLAREKRPIPPWFTLQIMMCVCDALDYTHNFRGENGTLQHIVHRDVTPENIMISYSGVPKVLDFGIAKARTVGRFTNTGTLKGKFPYMAPERILAARDGGDDSDGRSDIYSMGVILYEALSGALPFREANDFALLKKILEEPLPPLREAAPWVPAELDEIIMRALSKRPEHRQQSAGELREDLSRFLVERSAVTATERHVALFMARVFNSDGDATAADAGPLAYIPPRHLVSAPIEMEGFDAVKPRPTPMANTATPRRHGQVSVAALAEGEPELDFDILLTGFAGAGEPAFDTSRRSAADNKPPPPVPADLEDTASTQAHPSPAGAGAGRRDASDAARESVQPQSSAPLEAPRPALSPVSVPLALAPASKERCVLVVDGDAVSRRFVELALSKGDSLVVESASSALGALEILQVTPVDLVISDVELPDMSGDRFLRRLRQEGRLRNIPFFFLAADPRSSSKVLALQGGADDFLVKPVDSAELLARAHAAIERQKRLKENFQRRNYLLAGEFSAISVPDLVNMLEMANRTGTMSFTTPRGVGALHFDKGRIVHANFGSLVGAEAFYRLMVEGSGQFEFSSELGLRVWEQRSVTASTSELIREGIRRIDTQNKQIREGMAALPPNEPALEVSGTAPKGAGLVQGPKPTRQLGVQFELGIRDSFTLGELRLWTRSEVADWTSSGPERERLHVLLFADINEGVSQLLPLASPLTEQEVLSGLSAEEKLVGLSFFLRNERIVDVLLIDLRRPTAHEGWLLRRPSIAIVAPPGGDFQMSGTKAQVQLESLLERLAPAAVLGVGGTALEAGLAKLPYIRRPKVGFRCLPGGLQDGESELRGILVEGVRLWAQPPSE